MRRPVVILLTTSLLAGACATTATAPDDDGVTGVWRGWVVTSRDFVPATMEIKPDGTFRMSTTYAGAPRSVTGVVVVREGKPRIEGAGGWRGPLTISGAAPHRLLRVERDDRVYSARFTEAPP